MKSLLNLKPGRKGTKKLLAQYGDALLYVRYRYDEKRKLRLKTVEIVVDAKPWPPLPPGVAEDTPVFVRVAYEEHELRQLLKEAGGRWDPARKLWCIPYGSIRGTTLEERMMNEGKSTKMT